MAQCHFMVVRKNRLCKMRTADGRRYCGEHSHLEVSGDPGASKRIPCPYDGDHSVFEEDLERHLKKCNARPGPTPVYHRHNCNVLGCSGISKVGLFGQEQVVEGEGESLVFRGMEPEDFEALVKRVDAVAGLLGLGEIPYEEPVGVPVSWTVKETTQKEALVQRILQGIPQVCGPDSAVLEMGCGKGGLSQHLVSSCLDRFQGTHVFLVDRDNFKGKFDGKMGDTVVQRVKIDIKDLDLDSLLPGSIAHLAVISKHLCGAATCLTLAGLEGLRHARPNLQVQVFVALCCHHRCDIDMFAGQEAFAEPFALTPVEFARLCGMSSWAVCGWRYGSSGGTGKTHHFSGYTYEECTRIGWLCKAILNEFRLRFIKARLGLEPRLTPYIGRSITLENILLECP